MYSLVIKLKEIASGNDKTEEIDGVNVQIEINCKKLQLNVSSENTDLRLDQSFETVIFASWDLNEITSIELNLAVKVTNIIYKQ